MKKLVFVITFFACTASLYAQHGVVNFNSDGVTSRSGGNLSGEVEHINYGKAKSCDEIHRKYDDFMAYEQLYNIMGGQADKISVSYDDTKGTARIDFPEYMSNCMELEFHVIKYKKDNEKDSQGDYFLAVRNKFFDGNAKYRTGEYKDLTMQQKYDKCLKEGGVTSSEGDSDYNMAKVKRAAPSGLEIPLSLKTNGFTNLYFASSERRLNDGFEVVNKPEVAGFSNTCFRAEQIQKDSELIIFENGRQRDAYARYKNAVAEDCANCEYDALVEVFGELLHSGTGNATALDKFIKKEFQSPLQKKLMDMLDERVETIKDRLGTLKGNIVRAKSRSEASSAIDEYMELLKELDEKLLTRQIAYLEDRYNCEANGNLTNDERRACSEEISDLKTSIREISRGHYFGTSLLDKLNEFGFPSDAVAVKRFMLRAEHYGKYNGKDPNKPLKNIKDELEEFSKECEEAERVYLARYEGDVYSDMYETSIRRDQDRLETVNENYAQFIYETQQACQQTQYGYVNQVKCKRNLESATEVELLYREDVERLTQKINSYGATYDRFKGLELAYEKEQKGDDEDDDDDDSIKSSRVIANLLSENSNTISRSGGTSSSNMRFATSSGGNNTMLQQQQQQQQLMYYQMQQSPYVTGSQSWGTSSYYPSMMNSYYPNYWGTTGMTGGLNFNMGLGTGWNTGGMMMPWQTTGSSSWQMTPTTITPSSTTSGSTGTYTAPTGFN